MPAAEKMDLKDLPAWVEMRARSVAETDFKVPLKRCSLLVSAEMKRNIAEGHGPGGSLWPPSKGLRARQSGGGKLLQDRGLLLGSLTTGRPGNVTQINETVLVYGTNLDYAGTQQEGATILPVNARALAIPRTPEAYRAGSPRNFGRPLALVWEKGATSGRLIEERMGKKGKAQRPVTHYLLLPKAVVPPRPFVGWSQGLTEKCTMVIADFTAQKAGGR